MTNHKANIPSEMPAKRMPLSKSSFKKQIADKRPPMETSNKLDAK